MKFWKIFLLLAFIAAIKCEYEISDEEFPLDNGEDYVEDMAVHGSQDEVEDPLHGCPRPRKNKCSKKVSRKCRRQGANIQCGFYKKCKVCSRRFSLFTKCHVADKCRLKARVMPCKINYSGCRRPKRSSCKRAGNRRYCLLRSKCVKVCRKRCKYGRNGCKRNGVFVRRLKI
uniref:Cnidarian restricted protein n=1 Tax=Clytia hemisphaerica TaxID=252671 RepID=A0A7M5XL16_9CNID